jgi:hypothetical protein
MSASYYPINEAQVSEPVRRKVKVFANLLIGFGSGCVAMYVAGGQPQPVLSPIDMALMQPAQASRFMQAATPFYPVQPAGLRQPVAASASPELDEPSAMSTQQGRREMMTGLGFLAAGAMLQDQAANAAYGDGANVFGGITNDEGFFAYAGEGFSLLLPSKWKTCAEREYADVVFAYEDNFDQVNKLAVIKRKGGLAGSPEDFLQKNSFLLGQQAYDGKTMSEGGFAPDRVSAASVLSVGQATDKKGRKVYNYEVLTRTADGNEGGRHQLFKALESGGDLYILKVQMGDKRWFRGQKAEAQGILDSFTVA